MANFTDWLARTFFITKDQEQTANQVAAAQQSALDRQDQQGIIGPQTYLELSSDVANTGTNFYNQQLGKPGAAGVTGMIGTYAGDYWYLLLGLAIVLFIWMGGLSLIKGTFKE